MYYLQKKDTEKKVLKLVCTYVYFSEKDQSAPKVLKRDRDPRKLENTSLRRRAGGRGSRIHKTGRGNAHFAGMWRRTVASKGKGSEHAQCRSPPWWGPLNVTARAPCSPLQGPSEPTALQEL